MRFIERTPEYLALRAERRRIARRKWIKENPVAMQRARDNWKLNNHNRILNNRRERTRRLTGRCVTPRRSVSAAEKKLGARRRSAEWYHKHKLGSQLPLRNRLRSRIIMALRERRVSKSAKTLTLIGCSWEFLEAHIERQFTDGMSWDNRSHWHIDHIRPCASFDLSDKSQQEACFHWLNLRPLWSRENLSKGAKWRQME